MLRSRFLTIASRESALKTIRRASGYFIWTSIILLGIATILFGIEAITKASNRDIAHIAHSIGFSLGRVVRSGGLYILILMNGIALRRYKSRVAAILLILIGLVGNGIMLFALMVFKIAAKDLYIPLSTIVLFVSYVLIGGWALAAAIKLHGKFKDDPATPVSTSVGSR